MAASCRGGDLLGRIGGEEFLAVFADVTGPEAAAIAERLREAVARDAGADRRRRGARGDGQRRAGARWRRPTPLALSEALSRADAALYAAKAEGRNRIALAVARRRSGLRAPPDADGSAPPILQAAERAGLDLVGDVGLVLGEVLREHGDELRRLGVVGGRVGPGARAGRAAPASTPGTSTGTSKPKFGSRRKRRALSEPSSAAVSSARVAAIGIRAAGAVGAAGPAGVDQPAGGAGAGDAVAQQRAVDLRPARHERARRSRSRRSAAAR